MKLDLKSAYCIIPVNPDDHPLLAISWKGSTFVDRALPFGLRSASKIFSAVSDMIAFILNCHGIHLQIHYLDPPNRPSRLGPSLSSQHFLKLGVPVAVNKTGGPSTVITFLEILIDTDCCELRLPSEKLSQLRSLVTHWSTKKCCCWKDLEILLGHLSHAATVIYPGRTFLRELFIMLTSLSQRNHRHRISSVAKADLLW